MIEITTRFYYDIDGHKIAVYFAAYYDNGRFVEKECQLIIEKWEYAKVNYLWITNIKI